jgi:hypothetical protein
MMMVLITLMLVVAAEGERSDRYLFCAEKCDSKYKGWPFGDVHETYC